MEPWKSHVRVELFNRDCAQKDPFLGLFTSLCRLEARLDLHLRLSEDMQRCSPNGKARFQLQSDGEEIRRLYMQLKEGENAIHELTERVSDLTSTAYLKEAELQYCHSQVQRYRSEAVLLAKQVCSLRTDLSESEFILECQSKELAALRLEQRTLKEELATARKEKDELLDRWLQEKIEEAERVNKYNATQERWHRFAGRLNHYRNGGAHKPSSAKRGQVIWTSTKEQSPCEQD